VTLPVALRGAGMTQAALAARIGIAQTTLSGYISGRRRPSVQRARQIAVALGLALGDIAWPESDESGPSPVEPQAPAS